MIRFSLRSRARAHNRSPADRPQKPPQKKHFSPLIPGKPFNPDKSSPPSSYLVKYDALPRRLPNGQAVDYPTYVPSRYYIPSNTRRKPRTTDLRDASNALDLDVDTLARRRSTEDLIPVEKRISARIAELRRLLAEGDRLGDIHVLKDLVGIHEAKVSRAKHEADTLRLQIREARIIAGLTDPDDKPTLVRKVSGRPTRHFGGRTVSALKARTASMRSASRNHRTSIERERTPREHAPPGPTRVKPDVSRLSRKSSARLKRLGSAGSILIRRLSKVSVSEDASSGSSNETPASSTFDQETMKRLRMNPAEVISEYETELVKLKEADAAEVTKLQEAQRQLNEKRLTHCKAMEILDQFYGSLPGWEEDPIAHRMFPETAEMTEAGLEVERDLADARIIRERARAAREDHGRSLNGLNTIVTELNLFIEELDRFLLAINSPEKGNHMNITSSLYALQQHLEKCVRSARMAVECCSEAPRVEQLQRDLESMCDDFAQEVSAVARRGTIFQSDLGPTVHVGKTALCDCKLAETFVAARQNMITEDLSRFENEVERCEEYVMLERVGILDMHHPRENKR